MTREMLGAKIHAAHVTQVNLEYEGSCAIDTDLLDAAGIAPYERVHIYNITTGARLDTYAIPARRGSRTIGLNGAAARLAQRGDRIIIASYVQVDDQEVQHHKPVVVVLDDENRIVKTHRHSVRRKS
ncbi:aspartate 1-decarboxylase [bacterium]|nr:aspartate 1-decarboxylase [bacterium]MBU1985368.1 aspartate 1-decarboxylase [bacterium]